MQAEFSPVREKSNHLNLCCFGDESLSTLPYRHRGCLLNHHRCWFLLFAQGSWSWETQFCCCLWGMKGLIRKKLRCCLSTASDCCYLNADKTNFDSKSSALECTTACDQRVDWAWTSLMEPVKKKQWLRLSLARLYTIQEELYKRLSLKDIASRLKWRLKSWERNESRSCSDKGWKHRSVETLAELIKVCCWKWSFLDLRQVKRVAWVYEKFGVASFSYHCKQLDCLQSANRQTINRHSLVFCWLNSLTVLCWGHKSFVIIADHESPMRTSKGFPA